MIAGGEAPEYEPWSVAVEAVCSALEWFAVWREALSVEDAAREARISEATAHRFDDALNTLCNHLEDNEAAPDAPGAASDPTKEIHS